jgi:hypothetical protein
MYYFPAVSPVEIGPLLWKPAAVPVVMVSKTGA